MKTNYLIALCAMIFFAVSCGEGENVDPSNEKTGANNDEQTEEEEDKEPIIEGPVSMKGIWGSYVQVGDITLADWEVPINRADVDIVGGSGDYRVIYPKKMAFCNFWGTVPSNTPASRPDYSEEILKVWVEGNIVHIERGQPAYDPNGSGVPNFFMASFVLEDGSGTKKLLRVWSSYVVGYDPDVDYVAATKALIADDDYWQLEPKE